MQARSRTMLSRLFTAMLLVWLVALVVVRGRAWIRSQAADKTNATLLTDEWTALYKGRPPTLGSTSAVFRIIEFSDYQCPFCKLADPMLARFVAGHAERVALYRYDLPLSDIHKFAFAAAIAANCAAYQDVREPYQSLLFQHRGAFSSVDWTLLAHQSGVPDIGSFSACVNNEQPREHLLKDVRTAATLGVTSTPTFVINGILYKDGITEDALESLYRDSEKKRSRLLGRFLTM